PWILQLEYYFVSSNQGLSCLYFYNLLYSQTTCQVYPFRKYPLPHCKIQIVDKKYLLIFLNYILMYLNKISPPSYQPIQYLSPKFPFEWDNFFLHASKM